MSGYADTTFGGNPNCKCKASPSRKHGHYQLSSTRKGKSRSKFVRQQEVAAAKTQLKNYAKLRKLTERGARKASAPPVG